MLLSLPLFVSLFLPVFGGFGADSPKRRRSLLTRPPTAGGLRARRSLRLAGPHPGSRGSGKWRRFLGAASEWVQLHQRSRFFMGFRDGVARRPRESKAPDFAMPNFGQQRISEPIHVRIPPRLEHLEQPEFTSEPRNSECMVLKPASVGWLLPGSLQLVVPNCRSFPPRPSGIRWQRSSARQSRHRQASGSEPGILIQA